MSSENVVHSVAIHLLPWPALRLSTCFFSFPKGVLLLHFLLDWVLLSSSDFSQRGGTSCPDLGFFVKSLLDKMPFACRSIGSCVILGQSAMKRLVEPAVREQ